MYGSLGGFFNKNIFTQFTKFTPLNQVILRTLAKGPNTTTWIWNLHADAHDFDSHSDLEEISRKVFSAHFGQLGIILIWLSGLRHINIDSLKNNVS
jgi:hypothetical protein